MAFPSPKLFSRSSGLGKKVRISIRTRDTDLGLRQIVEDIRKLNGRKASAGVLLKDARKIYPKSKSILGQVARINEFGAGDVPQRAFMRTPFDNNNKKWANSIRLFMQKQTPRSTLDRRVLFFAGKLMKREIKKSLSLWKKPSNAISTIRRKGFNNPLIETRFLYKHINMEVKKQLNKE